MKKYYLFLCLGLYFMAQAKSQSTQQLIQLGGTSLDEARKIVNDKSGSVYVAGFFRNSIDVDPSTSARILSTNNPSGSSYIVKYDSAGALVWAFQMNLNIRDIDIDGADNIYLSGVFNTDSIDLDPDPNQSAIEYRNQGGTFSREIFIFSLNSNGVYRWSAVFGNLFSEEIRNLEVSGNFLYLCGEFSGTVDFDPGPGVWIDSSLGVGNQNIFLSKFDLNGNLAWNSTFGGPNTDYVSGTAVGSNEVIVYGSFSRTTVLDPSGSQTINPSGSFDGYINRFGINGNYIGNRLISGTAKDLLLDAKFDSNDNLYLIGSHGASLSLSNFNGPTLSSSNATNFYLIKLNSSWSYLWSESIEKSLAYSLELDYYEDPIVSTSVVAGGATVQLIGNNPVYLSGSNNPFAMILKGDKSGGWYWLKTFRSGNYRSTCTGISIDKDNQAFLCGEFGDQCHFGPPPFVLNSTGFGDGYLVKLSNNLITSSTSYQSLKDREISLYPNPANNQLNIFTNEQINDYIVYDLDGRLVLNGSAVNSYIDISNLSPAVYLIELYLRDGEKLSKKFIKR